MRKGLRCTHDHPGVSKKEGKLKDKISYVEGFDQFPQGILNLFKGVNTGKCLVRVPLLPGPKPTLACA